MTLPDGSRAVLLDSWAWLAWLNKRDQAHPAVRRYLEDLAGRTTVPLWTCWPVIFEVIGHVAHRAKGQAAWTDDAPSRFAGQFLELVGDGALVQTVLSPSEQQMLRALRKRADLTTDRRPSLVDCLLAVLCEDHGIRRVLSGDGDLYRLIPGVELVPEGIARRR